MLAFWYVYFPIERDAISMRNAQFHRHEDPGMFWISILFVVGVGISMYMLSFALFTAREYMQDIAPVNARQPCYPPVYLLKN